MPHVSNHKINGVISPSVNQVTDMLPKPWLEGWQRKIGFEAADKISKESSEKGTRFHDVFDMYWKLQLPILELSDVERCAVNDLAAWRVENKFEMKASEPHLESQKLLSHGSPDVGGSLTLPTGDKFHAIIDYKFKGNRYPDYKTILNEAAYAQMWLETYGTPITQIIILNFNRETGKFVKEISIPNNPEFLKDFMKLRRAWDVAQRANAWDDRYVRFKKAAVNV